MAEVATESASLTLHEARAMIDRGVAKARELKLAGTIVIVDGGGAVVSLSTLDGAPPTSVFVSRAKAYVSALSHRPSAGFASTGQNRQEVFQSFLRLYPEAPFAGPGGMPILKNGRCVGGISTSGGIGPYTDIEGVDPGLLAVDGKPANAEDLVICLALGIPYVSQHGERRLPADRIADGVKLPLPLDEARALAERAIARADQMGASVVVTVLDEYGVVIQQDRMDGAAAMMVDLSEAKAQTALNFRRPSIEVGKMFEQRPERREMMQGIVKFKIQPDGGAVPVSRDGRIVGVVGVAGVPGEQSDEIAKIAVGG